MAQMLAYATVLVSVTAPAEPPAPPAELGAWVDYARQLRTPGPDCPQGQRCVQVSRLEIRGHVDQGKVFLQISGTNLGRFDQSLLLLAPASTFSVVSVRWRRGHGGLRLANDEWLAAIEPGAFGLEVEVEFSPGNSLPMRLNQHIAVVGDRLTKGSLAFDESSDRHGGVVFLQSAARGDTPEAQVSVRAQRAIKYGSVVTFTYRYAITGLKEQSRIELPLLGGESIESLEPSVPYTTGEGSLAATLTPGASVVEVTGHFGKAPSVLTKPAALPFEHWLFEADVRHPIQLQSDGVEIDPGDVAGLVPGARSRAFFVEDEQTLTVTPVPVRVDAGRRAAAAADTHYWQLDEERWLGALRFNFSQAPKTDRIALPTPEPPHYADLGGEAARMFEENGVLSLRAAVEGDEVAPIGVQWREAVATNAVFSVPTLGLPAQSVHQEAHRVQLELLPGFVPLLVVGADGVQGDLSDGLHIYALLLAALAVALARAARFPVWATTVAGVIFAGLYAVSGFPRTELMLMLAGCALLVRLPDRSLMQFRDWRFLHGLASMVWMVLVLAALIPSTLYVKDRILNALHPWAEAEAGSDGLVLNAPRGLPQAATVEYKRGKVSSELVGDPAKEIRQQKGANIANQQFAVQQALPNKKAVEKTVRPVAYDAGQLPSVPLSYSLGSILPGDERRAYLLLAGPVLRGAWIFAECVGIAALFLLLLMRARRLWFRQGGLT